VNQPTLAKLCAVNEPDYSESGTRVADCSMKTAGSVDMVCTYECSADMRGNCSLVKLSLGSVRTLLLFLERQLSAIPVRPPPTMIGLLSVMQVLILTYLFTELSPS
jgi:hypothetical protein